MALDPVVTSSSSPDYKPYRAAINSIVTNKRAYDKGQQVGDQSLMDFAAQDANKYYSQIPLDLAAKLKSMDFTQANDFLQGLYGTPPAAQPQQNPQVTVNPNQFDSRIAGLLSQFTNPMTAIPSSPYDSQISALLTSLADKINNPATPVDPRSTPEFAAAQASVNQQVNDNIRQAQEALGASGFARSTNLANQAQTIAQQGTQYLETQLVPQIAQQLQARDQQGLQNSMALLQGLSQQQGIFDQRQQSQMQNLGTLLNALMGQQSVVDTRQQNQVQNNIANQNLDLNKQQVDLQRQAQDFNQQQAKVQNEMAQINQALLRTQNFGSVSEGDAAILGIPAGTPTFQAQEAVAQRQFELEQTDKQLSASRANLELQIKAQNDQLNTRIAADNAQLDKKIAADQKSQEATRQAARISDLINIWQANGVAPPGLESYGIQQGTPVNRTLTPSQQLDQLKLDEAQKEAAKQAQMNQLTPQYQASYSLDTTTAQALYSALENPTLESAMADIQNHEAQLRQMGVDTAKLKSSVKAEFDKKNNGGMTQPTTSDNSFLNVNNLRQGAEQGLGFLFSRLLGPGLDLTNRIGNLSPFNQGE